MLARGKYCWGLLIPNSYKTHDNAPGLAIVVPVHKTSIFPVQSDKILCYDSEPDWSYLPDAPQASHEPTVQSFIAGG